MSCPFFLPERRLDSGGWDPAPRLPLGDAWSGACLAGPRFEPPEKVQRELCNWGYARGVCPHFPQESAPDAVRFSVTGEEAGRLTILYVLERDHAPAEHGEFAEGSANERLAAQARAFLDSRARGLSR